jgi:hypothetical protein
MSYFKVLQRAAQGLSDAQPRPLSRYELPEAAWEVEADASDPGDARLDVPPQATTVRAAETRPEMPARTVLPPRADVEERQAGPATPPPASAAPPAPFPAPQAAIAAEPVTAVPAVPGQAAPEPSPPTLPPPSLAPAEPHRTPALMTREVEVRSESLVRVEAQPIPPAPFAEDRAGDKPQVVTLFPAPEPRPDTETAPPAAAQESAAPPPLIIEIGQIDIRLEAPARAAPAPTAPRRQTPVLSLDDYLRGRS